MPPKSHKIVEKCLIYVKSFKKCEKCVIYVKSIKICKNNQMVQEFVSNNVSAASSLQARALCAQSGREGSFFRRTGSRACAAAIASAAIASAAACATCASITESVAGTAEAEGTLESERDHRHR